MKTILKKITCSWFIFSMVISLLPTQVFAILSNDTESGIDIPAETVDAVEGDEEDSLGSELKSTDEVDTSSFESTDDIGENSGTVDQGQTTGTVDSPVANVNAVASIIESGVCGDNLTWTLSDAGALTISGTGPMYDWYYYTNTQKPAPWYIENENIVAVIINEGVTSIGNYAFYQCSLSKIEIPQSVTSIGELSFGNSGVENVGIPQGVTSIGRGAFNNCDFLKEIIIPKSVVSIGDIAFGNCDSLSSVEIFPGSGTRIGDRAFGYCASLENIIIPDTVAYIGTGAFDYTAYYKTAANWDDGVLYIDNWLVATNDSVPSSYVIKAGTIGIAGEAFRSNKNLKEIIVSDSVANICDNAFTYCTNMDTIQIGKNVVNIGSSAFYGCSNLEKVTLPDTISSIGGTAFANCSRLTSFFIPGSVTTIEHQLFQNCSSIASIKLGDGVAKIENNAFDGCTNLSLLIIPSTVTSVHQSKVYNTCPNLITAGPLEGEYNIRFGWTSAIPEFAFRECESLNTAVIPNGITDIERYAFYQCTNLKSIVIPSTVTNIGIYAFSGCSNIKDVYYLGNQKQWDSISISSSSNKELLNANIHFNATSADYETKFYVSVYASKPLLANKVGDIIDFCCGIYTSDGQTVKWTNPSIVTDNSDLVYVSGYFEKDSLAYFQVKGLAEGTCTLTITDSATDIYGKIDLTFGSGITSTKSYRIDQVPNFVVDESTWIFGQAQTQTNFYNVNGLYVNQFASNYNAATGKFDVSFSVYNSRYYNGAVDVFDASGKWIETYEIGKVTSARSIQDTFGDGWNLIADLVVEKKGLSYTLSSSAKETSIKLSVPKGGYFTISNNYVESPGVFMFNVLEYIALSANTIFDLGLNLISGDSMDISVLSSFKKTTKDAILDSEFLSDQFMSTMRSYALKAAETSARFSIGETAGVMTCSFEELLKSLDIDLEFIAKTELGIAESAFRKLTGPIGVGFNAMFSISKYGDLTTQTIEYLNSSNKPYIIIYATEDAYTNSTVNGVTVDDRTDSIDKEAVLQVFKLEYEEAIPVIKEKEIPTGQYELYSICFLKNGEESPINGTVTVMIPIPDSYKKESCVILRQEKSGSWTELEYTIQDNFLVFETTHFSLYAIADMSDSAATVHFAYDEFSMQLCTTKQLEFSVGPTTATTVGLVWESNNPMVASVDNHGVIRSFSPGTAIITVKTANGSSDSCVVTVSSVTARILSSDLDSTTVRVIAPENLLPIGISVYGACYNDGQMINLCEGTLLSDNTVVFRKNIKSDTVWTLFFLDPKTYAPLCEKVILQ